MSSLFITWMIMALPSFPSLCSSECSPFILLSLFFRSFFICLFWFHWILHASFPHNVSQNVMYLSDWYQQFLCISYSLSNFFCCLLCLCYSQCKKNNNENEWWKKRGSILKNEKKNWLFQECEGRKDTEYE